VRDLDIAQQRLRHQHIAGERFGQPDEVVRWMGAMQAQEYQQALWAIGLRMRSATRVEIEAAIAAREIVQTWLMRGTLHVVAAEHVTWMRELLAPRRLAAAASRLKQLELDSQTLERCAALFQGALRGGKLLTRSEMMRLLETARISPQGQRGYTILWYLAMNGLICLGPMREKEQTFALLDEWVPASRQLSRGEALAKLAGGYFASHGPATADDFAHWAGLTLTDARAGLDAVRSSLHSEKRGVKLYWSSTAVPDYTAYDAPSVHLLPGFDEYLLGYKERGDVLAAAHAHKVVPGGNGIFFPMIVAGGQVVGTWKRALKTGALSITLSPFTPLDIPKERIMEAAQRFTDFLGLPLASVEMCDA
jgi:hypothetical protein